MPKRKRPYRRAEQTRQHVVDVAGRLFYAEGIHAVGVDRLAACADVTTTTLYRLFGSKEGLIAAYLRREDERWSGWLDVAASAGGLPRFFDELDERVSAAAYRGCPFRLALAEYPSADSEIHRVAIGNKQRTRARFRELAAEAGCRDADSAADQLMVISDGLCACAAERAPGSRAGTGSAMVRSLLQP